MWGWHKSRHVDQQNVLKCSEKDPGLNIATPIVGQPDIIYHLMWCKKAHITYCIMAKKSLAWI